MHFTVNEVLAASCAIHRLNNGFVKSHDTHNEKGLTPNSKLLYNHFLGSHTSSRDKKLVRQLVTIKPSDNEVAGEIVDYLSGLSFKAMERDLTDFEKNVLKLITSEFVGKDQIGIAASLPKVYFNKLKQDEWSVRESALVTSSEHVGKLHSRNTFKDCTVENIRFISSVGSSLICCSQDGNIIKFFINTQNDLTNLKVGSIITFKAYVKSQDISKYHGGKETMVNRVALDK
jgi:hypothetical protein